MKFGPSRVARFEPIAIRALFLWGLAVAILAPAVLIFAWSRDPGPMVEVVPVEAECPQNATHFPIGSFFGSLGSADHDAVLRRLNSEFYTQIGEPPIWCGQSTWVETYRFRWSRAFHDTIIVRVYTDGTHFALNGIVVASAYGPTEPPQILERAEVVLTRQEWDAVRTAADRVDFRAVQPSSGWFDGSTWELEVRAEGQYRVIGHHSGDVPIPDIGMRLVSLAGLRPPDDEIY